MNNVEHIQNSPLDGGDLCLNFINTIKDRLVAEPTDYLTGKEEWIAWLRHVDVLEDDYKDDDNMNFDLAKLIKKRELFHRVFQGLVYQREIKEKDLKCLEILFVKIRRSTKLLIANHQPHEYLEIAENDLNSYLLKIGKAAQDLLVSKEIDRIKECGNCGWIYFDSSKNKCRRWCNMETCGNEVKARKYYESKKKQLKKNV